MPAIIGLGAFGLTSAGLAAAYETFQATRVTTPEIPIGAIPQVTDGHDISLPIDAYRNSPAALTAISRAEFKYAKECAAKFGVTFDATAPTAPENPSSSDYYRLFDQSDLASAKQFGYHPAGITDDEQTDGTSTLSKAESDPNYDTVVAGGDPDATVGGLPVPSGGCMQEARTKVGDSSSDSDLLEEAMGYGLSQSDHDARVIAGFAAWSSCMKSAGFVFATPTEAVNNPQWATRTASATEIATATADVECKLQSNLTGLRVAVASAWIDKFIASHSDSFSSMKQRYAAEAAKAESVLSE